MILKITITNTDGELLSEHFTDERLADIERVIEHGISTYGSIEEYEEANQSDEPGDGMTDAEADADTLKSAGYGTDEDYGFFGDYDNG